MGLDWLQVELGLVALMRLLVTVNPTVYDNAVQWAMLYTGQFADVRVYPLRVIKICNECGGCARESQPSYGRCRYCDNGYPHGLRPTSVPA